MNLLTLAPAGTTRGFRLGFGAMAAMLLAIPAVAMQFTGEVNWGPGDFLIAGAMFAALGAAIDAALRLPSLPRLRAALVGTAVIAFLLIWAELAVGLFD